MALAIFMMLILIGIGTLIENKLYMDEKRMKDVIDTFKKSSIEMHAFLSKDKEDNWTVTRQLYNMSADILSVNERIYNIEHTIANLKPNHDYYKIGQKVYGKLLEDGTYYISSICVDTNNYDI
jgi:hypothetical protein